LPDSEKENKPSGNNNHGADEEGICHHDADQVGRNIAQHDQQTAQGVKKGCKRPMLESLICPAFPEHIKHADQQYQGDETRKDKDRSYAENISHDARSTSWLFSGTPYISLFFL